MTENKRKCGIVTFHSAHNYGSVLQSYAMVMTMLKLGLDAELIDYRHPHTVDMYEWRFWTPYKNWKWNIKDFILRGLFDIGKERETIFKEFIENKLLKSKRIRSVSDIDSQKYDVLVCGSDQIWNYVSTGENAPIYFLNFGNTACKFSYAASAGSSKFPKEEYKKYYGYLNRLKSIGVREQSLKEYIFNDFGLKAEVNPDPTLLLKIEDWQKIEVAYPGLPQKYLLVYTLAKVDATLEFARQIANSLNLPVVQICNTRGIKWKNRKYVDYNLMNASPQQFLWLFHHAAFIVTNTFHGNMFSIIFRKNFVHYDINGNDSRITTLHKAIGLNMQRMIRKPNELIEIKINYALIEEKIGKYANEGIAFISKNINENER